jgi:hypothetical protein
MFLKRMLGTFLMGLGAIGVVFGLVGIVGTWVVIGPLRESTTRILGRVHDTLGVASQSVDHVLSGLRDGQTQLAALQAAPAKKPGDVPNLNWLQRRLANDALRRLGPQVGNAGQTIAEVHDAAIVLQNLLGQANELPIRPFNDEQVQGLSDRLARVEDQARDLSALLAQLPDAKEGEGQTAAISRTEMVLARLIAALDDFQSRLGDVRGRVEEVETQTDYWLRLAPVLVPLILLWITAGQVSLVVHGWSWARRPPRTTP